MTREPNGLYFGTKVRSQNYITAAGPKSPTGLLQGGGSTSYPITTGTANKNFLGFWVKSTATSGDCRGLYMRLYLAGAAGNGEAGRFYTTCNAASVDSAHGVHSTVSIGTTGAISGLAAGLRATLEAASATRNLGGTICGLQIDSNIGANNTVTGTASMIRLAKSGTVDVPYFLDISDDQCLKGSAASGAASDALKVRLPDGTVRYISLVAAS